MTSALVLLSGGLDSTTCAALAVEEFGYENVRAVSFQYGQKHSKETWHARVISNHYCIPHEAHQLPNVFMGAGSTLIDPNMHTPECSYAEIKNVSPTYVPFRNGILCSYAAAVALTKGCDLVYFGAHSEDASNWAYPDCTPEFIGSLAAAIYVGTYHKVRLVTPLQWLDKKAIIALGTRLNAPYELTWSCYNGGEIACGKCPTCISRREAFEANGLKDPVEYADEVGSNGE